MIGAKDMLDLEIYGNDQICPNIVEIQSALEKYQGLPADLEAIVKINSWVNQLK
mgnify:CR=1 FL=1